MTVSEIRPCARVFAPKRCTSRDRSATRMGTASFRSGGPEPRWTRWGIKLPRETIFSTTGSFIGLLVHARTPGLHRLTPQAPLLKGEAVPSWAKGPFFHPSCSPQSQGGTGAPHADGANDDELAQEYLAEMRSAVRRGFRRLGYACEQQGSAGATERRIPSAGAPHKVGGIVTGYRRPALSKSHFRTIWYTRSTAPARGALIDFPLKTHNILALVDPLSAAG
jgi:hypothetical protein